VGSAKYPSPGHTKSPPVVVVLRVDVVETPSVVVTLEFSVVVGPSETTGVVGEGPAVEVVEGGG